MAGGSVSGRGSKHPVKIFANIFIAFIGAGVLGLPYAFREAGILEGILIMTFVAVVSTKAMLLIIDCNYKIKGRRVRGIPDGMKVSVNAESVESLLSSETMASSEEPSENGNFMQQEADLMIRVKDPKACVANDLSYGDVGFHALGHTGRILVDIAIVISQTGFCCAYIIFISENLADYIKGVHIGEWLLVLLPPLFLLTLLRHLSSLALSSLLAQVSNLMAFGVVFWFDFEHLFKITMHPKEMSLRGFPFFLAIAIYCYEGAGMILALESSVAEEVRHKFKKFFVSAMLVVTTLYITFGACGYLSFGPETKPIITLNLPKGSGLDFGMMVKSCLCLGIFFTYPVMLFPVVKILEAYFLPDAGKSVWKANMLRFFLVVLTGFVVLAVPNFANLMALVGASCCTLLAFILPGIFHLNVFKGTLTKSEKLFDIFLIGVGIMGTLVGTWDALKRLSDTPQQVDFIPEGTAPTLTNLTHLIPPTNISVTTTPLHNTTAGNLTVTSSSLISTQNDTAVEAVLSMGSKVAHLLNGSRSGVGAGRGGTKLSASGTMGTASVLQNLTSASTGSVP